jgi:hypothetical protein
VRCGLRGEEGGLVIGESRRLQAAVRTMEVGAGHVAVGSREQENRN